MRSYFKLFSHLNDLLVVPELERVFENSKVRNFLLFEILLLTVLIQGVESREARNVPAYYKSSEDHVYQYYWLENCVLEE